MIREIEKISASLAAKGVSEKEVELACKPIITHIRGYEKKIMNTGLNQYLQAPGHILKKLTGQDILWDDYKSINVREINDLAGKYFNKKKGGYNNYQAP